MKKIILTLGLGALITMPNLLASDSITTEPLADQPLIVENRLKGFYIKPFCNPGDKILIIRSMYHKPEATVNIITNSNIAPNVSNLINTSQQAINYNDMRYSNQITITNKFVAGIALGTSLNKYTAIEGSFSYYSGALELYNFKPKDDRSYFHVGMNTDLNIINAMLSPIISINVTKDTSLYCKAGIGVSYFMFSSNVNDWSADVGAQLFNKIEQDSLSMRDQKTASDSPNINHPFFKGPINNYNKQKNHLSWLLGVGGRMNLTESIELDIGYSYKSLGSLPSLAEASNPGVDKGFLPLHRHEVLIGLKFNF